MILKKDEIAKWDKHIYAYFNTLEADKESEGDGVILERYLSSFAKMLKIMCNDLGTRDEWEFFYSGDFAFARSKKMEHDFRFGAYLTVEYYMECFILHPKHLKKMSNDFWRILLELGDFGHFRFEENCTSSNGKSSIFNIVQAYLELETNAYKTDDDPFIDFGSFVVSWPLNTSINELFLNAFEVFRRVYKLNYMLYRAEYLAQKSKKKETKINKRV